MLDDLLLVFAEAEEEAGLRPGAALMAGNNGPVGPSNSGPLTTRCPLFQSPMTPMCVSASHTVGFVIQVPHH